MITHANMMATIAAANLCVKIGPGDVYIAFLPLAHVLELAVESTLLFMGGCLGYANPR